MTTREGKAVDLFSNGYNCAQSVLGAFCAESGLDINTAFKLANGFGEGYAAASYAGPCLAR